jgi:hypothetical protein
LHCLTVPTGRKEIPLREFWKFGNSKFPGESGKEEEHLAKAVRTAIDEVRTKRNLKMPIKTRAR